MMQECNEYNVGFCTKNHFKVKELTQECDLLHSKISKQKFTNSDILMGFESDVYDTFSQIINECDKKIQICNEILANTSTDEEHRIFEVYSKCLIAFESNSTNRTIYKIMQDLYEHMFIKNIRFSFCEICGAFCKTKDEPCEHFLHESYKKLREITEKLRTKIIKVTK